MEAEDRGASEEAVALQPPVDEGCPLQEDVVEVPGVCSS